MTVHKNARLSRAVCERTVRKWVARSWAEGSQGLRDRPSRPHTRHQGRNGADAEARPWENKPMGGSLSDRRARAVPYWFTTSTAMSDAGSRSWSNNPDSRPSSRALPIGPMIVPGVWAVPMNERFMASS